MGGYLFDSVNFKFDSEGTEGFSEVVSTLNENLDEDTLTIYDWYSRHNRGGGSFKPAFSFDNDTKESYCLEN